MKAIFKVENYQILVLHYRSKQNQKCNESLLHSQARITSEVSNVDSPRRSMVEIPPSYAMQPVFCHCKGNKEITGVLLI